MCFLAHPSRTAVSWSQGSCAVASPLTPFRPSAPLRISDNKQQDISKGWKGSRRKRFGWCGSWGRLQDRAGASRHMSTADWLLIPAPQAAQKLGISRRSLRNRIDSGLIRSVKVGPRVYIHKTELERVVNGKPKPEAPEEISLTEKNSEDLCQRVLADVESINIFAGPNADQWNRVLARAEGERLKETR